MNPELNKIYCGDAFQVLRSWPDNFIHCVVTSPPYWGLRDYGVKGQLGLESTPEKYIAHMVGVFKEVRRVLRDDGTLWLNIGDSYASNPSKGGSGPNGKNGYGENYARGKRIARGSGRWGYGNMNAPGLKAKDLVGIPWMLAFALRADGWYLRQDIIWAKPNPMPESVTDRCTKAHEYIFMLSKSARYLYDQDAIKEKGSLSTKMPDGWNTGPGAHGTIHPNGREKDAKVDKQRGHGRRHDGFNDRWDQMEKEKQCSGMANKRSVWTVATMPFKEAHFATFPEDLIAPCILAGCPEGGTVFDPFMGAGTTGLVAARFNRNFLGIELNPEYVNMAEKRIAPELAQTKFI